MEDKRFGIKLSRECIAFASEPIDDLEKRGWAKYSKDEETLRRKTASLYRLVDLLGWTEGLYGHITTRLGEDSILINPFGLFFHEITASSLVSVNLKGDIVDTGSTIYGINDRGYVLHSAIHAARHDVVCAIHLHTPEVVAFSSIKRELLPLYQESNMCGDISYHGYHGVLTDLEEREDIAKSLGLNNVMILKNHGFVTCGKTVEEAFHRAYFLLYAIQAQIKMLAVDKKEWEPVNMEAYERGKASPLAHGETIGVDSNLEPIQWGLGGLDWEAWMRLLDRLGLQTGHEYRVSVWRGTHEHKA